MPVYNEAATLPEILSRVAAAAPGLAREILVVDDGSTDGSTAILEAAATKGTITLIALGENRGKGSAVRSAIPRARGAIVLFQDADLEMDPDDYPALVDPILRGECDVVFGSRFAKIPRSMWNPNIIANRLLSTATNFLYGSDLTDMETAFKVFRTETLRKLRLESRGFELEPEISGKLLRIGAAIREVPVSYHPRGRVDGKKVRVMDGFQALWALCKWRFVSIRRVVAA